jgi:pilus assembly protein CpaE
MSKQAYSVAEEGETGRELVAAEADMQGVSAPPKARPIPRISIQAFCEDPGTAEALQAATGDRRLAKSHVSVHMGGASAAVAHYLESPTPNLIIVETTLPRDQMLGELDRLAECCDAGTKVVVISHMNDVFLYRELIKRGVSEYLIAPIGPMQLIESLSALYNNPDTDPVGNVIAFIGAKGGVGSSTVCHNAAWAMSEILKSNVIVADLDLAFGTTGLDFNQDPVQGIAEALQSPERLDEVLLDRLLTKCSERLSIFAAPVVLDRDYDISADACDIVLDIVRQNVPFVAVDLPHTWTPWVKRVLLQADEIVVTAVPDLANLRNAKNLIDLLKQNRNNDGPPRLVINMAKMPKRPEISVKEFAAALDLNASLVIEFDCESFGLASNNGQMIEEFSGKAKAAPQFRELALTLAHRKEHKEEKKKSSLAPLGPLLEKLKFKR